MSTFKTVRSPLVLMIVALGLAACAPAAPPAQAPRRRSPRSPAASNEKPSAPWRVPDLPGRSRLRLQPNQRLLPVGGTAT